MIINAGAMVVMNDEIERICLVTRQYCFADPDVETLDWRAVCGKTARTVRRAGSAKADPDPYLRWMFCALGGQALSRVIPGRSRSERTRNPEVVVTTRFRIRASRVPE